ncbi:ATP-binding protein [Shumkonia mesophila]|uniref:ATP-binding protein n=1 Tax=Shumkonia mesophila TaxID=2838854 RepID=UPI0029342516|nr:ATP-binding protein [Shumkonia mesophila]
MPRKRKSTPILPQWIFRGALDNAKDVILVTEAEPLDEPGPKIVYANQAFYELTGFTPEETIGNDPRMLQGEDTDRATLDRVRAALKAHEPVRVEVVNYTKSGQSYWLDMIIVPLRDPHGKVTHFAAIERDITAVKSLERDLMRRHETATGEVQRLAKANDVIEASRRQLCELDAENNRLLSIIGHDLRNAFTAIIGFTSLLEGRLPDLSTAQVANEVTRIHRVVKDSHRMLENLLAYSLMQRETPEAKLQPVSLSPLVERVLGVLEERAARKGIMLEPLASEHLVVADERMLEVVIRNLVENAIKFSHAGGRVRILGRDVDGRSRIGVSDSGIGMSEAQVRSILDHQRVKPQRGTAEEKGTGFGLILCGQLIRKMGGQLSVRSELGKGSTFELVLDRVP